MHRRNVLRVSATTLAGALAGCNGIIDWREQSPTEDPTTEVQPTTSATTTIGPAETRYSLGTAHDHAGWKFAVVDVELTDQFETDDGETYEMPDGETLGIATITVENLESTKRGWSGVPLAMIYNGSAYQEQLGFHHPAFSNRVNMDELKRIEHSLQYSTSAYPVEPGETVTTWELFILPEVATRDEVSVGFDGTTESGTTYPIRWLPN